MSSVVIWGQVYSKERLSCETLSYRTMCINATSTACSLKSFTLYCIHLHGCLFFCHFVIQGWSVKSGRYFIRFVNDHIALKTTNTSTNMVFAKSSMRERISFYQKRQSQSKIFFFLQQGLFDWLSGITHLSRYWSEVPKGMWHHYEAWPYHLLPCSLYAGLGQNLMPPPPKRLVPGV